jgi:cell division protein FtsQ
LRSLGVDAIRRRLAGGEEAGEGSRVLPRFLRRPVRALSRMEWQTPRHFGLKAMAGLFLATATTGMVLGDHTWTVISAVTAASGLAVDQVKITGQSETSEVDVLDKLAIGRFPSLFTFDLDAARTRVEALPWVAQATLKKLYPDTLEVAVVERLPYALWQHGNAVSLIDPQGRVITDAIGERYASLPLVVGPGANTRVDEFLDLILAHPELVPRVRAGVLISERRWNVVLAEAVEIMLPEHDAAAALARVAEIDAASQLLSRDIAAVDLRLPGELVVRLSEPASLARQEAIKEREKVAHKMGTDT